MSSPAFVIALPLRLSSALAPVLYRSLRLWYVASVSHINICCCASILNQALPATPRNYHGICIRLGFPTQRFPSTSSSIPMRWT
ncbi:hypothetical protein C8R44DRAFT_226759 [Mycena epipterygia]|nr:hypothetical protein C8R44DRAFT_226759 [Mycena epipterygia]